MKPERAGAPAIEITDEMVEVGVKALRMHLEEDGGPRENIKNAVREFFQEMMRCYARRRPSLSR
jgi:hypothetical protein